MFENGPQLEQLDEVHVRELLPLDAHVDRIFRARALELVETKLRGGGARRRNSLRGARRTRRARVVELALERRVVLVAEVYRQLFLRGVGAREPRRARAARTSSSFGSLMRIVPSSVHFINSGCSCGGRIWT